MVGGVLRGGGGGGNPRAEEVGFWVRAFQN